VNQKTTRLAFLLSFLLLTLVGLGFTSLLSDKNKTTSENNLSLSQNFAKGRVLPGSVESYYYKFYLKDASVLGAVLPGTSEPDSSLITGATATVVNKTSFHCGDSGSDYNFAEYTSGLYKIICQEVASMQVRITKSGYQSKTAAISHYQGEIPIIYLTKYVPPPLPPPPETIKDITLPPVFREEGTQTTDLSKVVDPAKVENLTLDTTKATIKIKEVVDLSSTAVKDKFKELDDYVKLDTTALVFLDSVSLPEINKKAAVTMKGLPWLAQPRVLVDGRQDKSIVSNIKYVKGTLTFDVTHFSVLQAAPSINISEPVNNFSTKENQINLVGKVTDPTASVSAKLNKRDLGKLKIATASGKFSAKVNLAEGVNKIVVNALSANGATASATVSGTLVLEKNLFLYIILGFLAWMALIIMGIAVFKMRKKKDSSTLSQPSKTKD